MHTYIYTTNFVLLQGDLSKEGSANSSEHHPSTGTVQRTGHRAQGTGHSVQGTGHSVCCTHRSLAHPLLQSHVPSTQIRSHGQRRNMHAYTHPRDVRPRRAASTLLPELQHGLPQEALQPVVVLLQLLHAGKPVGSVRIRMPPPCNTTRT